MQLLVWVNWGKVHNRLMFYQKWQRYFVSILTVKKPFSKDNEFLISIETDDK